VSAATPLVLLDTPQGSLPLKATLERVPEDSDAQVAATIRRMCEYVNFDCQAGPIRYDAQSAIDRDPRNPLAGIHSLVRDRLRFRKDEALTQPFEWMLKKPEQDYFVECLKRPIDVALEFHSTGVQVEGDCDDFSMYTAALLRALGIDCAFATVGANPDEPGIFSHVYVVAYWRGARIPMDCSHGPCAGWEYAAPGSGLRHCEWPIHDRASYGLVGLGFLALAWLAWQNRETIREVFA